MTNVFVRALVALSLILQCGSLVHAQSTFGTITGLVTDKSGSVIPNAVVVATNTATGVRAQTVQFGHRQLRDSQSAGRTVRSFGRR